MATVIVHALGVVLMMCSDAQKHYTVGAPARPDHNRFFAGGGTRTTWGRWALTAVLAAVAGYCLAVVGAGAWVSAGDFRADMRPRRGQA